MASIPRTTPLQAPALVDARQVCIAAVDGAALQGLSFSIVPGLTVLRGGEGRGKTTLLRLLAGQFRPSAGSIETRARTVFHHDPRDRRVDAVVARQWLQSLQPAYADWQTDAVDELVDAFGLREHIDKPLYMLSTGSRRKVGLVAAAASRADLVLLDTPFAALDGPSCRLLTELLQEAADNSAQAWVLADYELPTGIAPGRLAALIDLGA